MMNIARPRKKSNRVSRVRPVPNAASLVNGGGLARSNGWALPLAGRPLRAPASISSLAPLPRLDNAATSAPRPNRAR